LISVAPMTSDVRASRYALNNSAVEGFRNGFTLIEPFAALVIIPQPTVNGLLKFLSALPDCYQNTVCGHSGLYMGQSFFGRFGRKPNLVGVVCFNQIHPLDTEALVAN
jgi:hypothetical protein